MGLQLLTNLQSMNAQSNLAKTTQANDESMEKVSSGSRINKAADDAAGFAISEKLKADIRGLNMAKRNANDGISLVQTAEGSMNEIGNILSRLRELSIQGASDTIGNEERSFIHKEYNALKDEIDRITMSTEYNGQMLLAGDPKNLPESFRKNATPPPFEVQVGKNWSRSTDSPDASGPFDKNPVNIIRLNFDKLNTGTGEDGLNIGASTDESTDSAGVFLEDDVQNSKHRAQQSIEKIDQALQKVARYRSELGATQNRLNSTISNLAIQTESYSAANSRIRDTDFAEETARLTQTNILKQAGVSVLSQANQSPAAALSLLR